MFQRLFWKLAKTLLKRGYGYEAEKDRDYHDFPGQENRWLMDYGCPGCRASEVQDWIEQHMNLL